MKYKEEQFTQIPDSLMSNKDLTDSDKLTLGLILSWFKNNKECYMGNEYIAKKLGITSNAASIRIKRLEKIGCISLRYTYKESKKEVDKRFITLLSITPKVSCKRRKVSCNTREGIVSHTKGYRVKDDEVSCKQGGIIQDVLDNVLDKVLDKVSHKVLNNKNEIEEELYKINLIISEDNFENPEERNKAREQRYNLEKELKKLTSTKNK